MTETLSLIVLLIPCLIVAIVFHEVAHGWVAMMLGDPTAKNLDRLSLNPIRHVDPVGTLLVPGFLALVGGPIFGWAKPVPVRKDRLNNPRFGMMAVAAAGPATNLILAALGAVALGFYAAQVGPQSLAMEGAVLTAFNLFIVLNIFLALFNLLPIPPFDGSHILEGLLPRSLAAQFARLQQIGMLLLIVFIAVSWAFPQIGIVEKVVLPPVQWLQGEYLQMAERFAERFS